MHAVFRKQIFGSLLVSPTSNKYKENSIIQESKRTIENLEETIAHLKGQRSSEQKEKDIVKKEYQHLIQVLRSKGRNLNDLKHQLTQKEEEISQWRNRSFLRKVLDLFK